MHKWAILDGVERASPLLVVADESQRKTPATSDVSVCERELPTTFVFERLFKNTQDPDAQEGHLLYLLQWFRYAEGTWEQASGPRRNKCPLLQTLQAAHASEYR